MRLLSSDPLYPEYARAQERLAQLTNPSLFWDLAQVPEVERRVMLAEAAAEVVERWQELSR